VFAPYNWKYSYLKQHVLAASLIGTFIDDDGVVQDKVNKWKIIHDFTKREDNTPNYTFLPPSEFKFLDYFKPSADPEDNEFMFEYNIEYGGTLKESSTPVADSLMAFDITTSAKEA
tara:strand:- start:591 stop:938 length:348 start_codon:yes stop_codon:yes gene_type:complete